MKISCGSVGLCFNQLYHEMPLVLDDELSTRTQKRSESKEKHIIPPSKLVTTTLMERAARARYDATRADARVQVSDRIFEGNKRVWMSSLKNVPKKLPRKALHATCEKTTSDQRAHDSALCMSPYLPAEYKYIAMPPAMGKRT
eukprot:CAMPEP_0169356594 /NCGR_PEP_ID=MMETSP1017-20121227/27626_1 /TAXON_ID=342587 /ORGANISM="Karlodinium micrum, Strain CCMP2283" /LENGTH=142 /DNA_ID=CAMNT_0009453393 /DNA_START=148 /DNA_END=572 /DNA_ORIENTATION=-